MRAVRARPISPGSSADAPPSGISPTRVKANWKYADGAATTRSQASASAHPKPTAAPCTPAITGLGSEVIARTTRLAASAAPAVSPPVRSPPEQNAFPAPVSSTVRTASSAAALPNCEDNSSSIGVSTALSFSGRSSRIRRTVPSCSTEMPFTTTGSQAEVAADDVLHNLGGAAEDRHDAVVHIVAGDPVFRHIPIATMQLDAAVDHLLGSLGAPPLGFRRLDCGQFAVHDRLQAPVDVLLADLEFGVHLGQQESVVLETADRLAESLAVLGILQRLPPGLACARDSGDGDGQPLRREVVHQVIEAASLLAQQIRRRHPHVLEGQFGGVLVVQPHLFELASAAETLHARLDDQQREALLAGFGVGTAHHHHQVAVDTRRDESLGAIDDPVVTIADRRGANTGQVAARARFGHRDGDDQFAADDARQPALLLFVVGQRREVRSHNVVLQAQRGCRPSVAGDFFVDDGVEAEVVDSPAAVLLRHVETDQAVLAGGDERGAVDETVTLPLLGVGHQLTFDELPDRLAERLVLRLQDESLHVVVSLSIQSSHFFTD